jgi:hypothetical protein
MGMMSTFSNGLPASTSDLTLGVQMPSPEMDRRASTILPLIFREELQRSLTHKARQGQVKTIFCSHKILPRLSLIPWNLSQHGLHRFRLRWRPDTWVSVLARRSRIFTELREQLPIIGSKLAATSWGTFYTFSHLSSYMPTLMRTIWSVLMRRIKTPSNDYLPNRN